MQTSRVQRSPSSQAESSGVFTHSPAPSHASAVQSMPSSAQVEPAASGISTHWPAPSHAVDMHSMPSSAQSEPAASNLQVDEQQSPLARFPSSQSSPSSTIRLPHSSAPAS